MSIERTRERNKNFGHNLNGQKKYGHYGVWLCVRALLLLIHHQFKRVLFLLTLSHTHTLAFAICNNNYFWIEWINFVCFSSHAALSHRIQREFPILISNFQCKTRVRKYWYGKNKILTKMIRNTQNWEKDTRYLLLSWSNPIQSAFGSIKNYTIFIVRIIKKKREKTVHTTLDTRSSIINWTRTLLKLH